MNRIILDVHVLSWKKGGHGEDDGLTTNIKTMRLNYRERFICHTIACMLDSMKKNIYLKSEFWFNLNRIILSPFWVKAVRDPGLTIRLSYEVLSTNGRPRSLEEQCPLQLKVNLDDVQIKNLRNKILLYQVSGFSTNGIRSRQFIFKIEIIQVRLFSKFRWRTQLGMGQFSRDNTRYGRFMAICIG